MAETRTLNYNWLKPDPGASANTWGSTLNATTDKIDAQMSIAMAAGTYVGFVNMYGGATPPINWLWCDNALYDQTAWPLLYACIGVAFNVPGDPVGKFRTPILYAGRGPVGANDPAFPIGARGGEFNHTLTQAEMPIHTHNVSDPQHFHYLADTTHTHGITQSPHGHGITDPQHAHGPNQGVSLWAHVASGGVAGTAAGSNMADSVTTGGSTTGITINGANASISVNGATLPNNWTAGNATNISVLNAGSGATHNNMPPYCAIGFIIRAA